jgi:surfactin synthase thioesterase subunit
VSNKYITCLSSTSEAPVTVLCFPHAGGGSFRYRAWHNRLSDQAEILIPNLPGRERRIHESAYDNLSRVTEEILPHLSPWFEKPVFLAGISYGALLAYEMAVRLEKQGVKIRGLLVASQRAPNQPLETLNWNALSEADLISKLVEIGGLELTMANDPEFRQLFLPTIRADLQASYSYCTQEKTKLNCPVHVWHGLVDPAIREKEILGWAEITSGKVTYRDINAGHFLTKQKEDLWLDDLQNFFSQRESDLLKSNDYLTEMTRKNFNKLGLHKIAHLDVPLADHMAKTAEILFQMGCPEHVCLAGLYQRQ